jgi:hypothetical protein
MSRKEFWLYYSEQSELCGQFLKILTIFTGFGKKIGTKKFETLSQMFDKTTLPFQMEDLPVVESSSGVYEKRKDAFYWLIKAVAATKQYPGLSIELAKKQIELIFAEQRDEDEEEDAEQLTAQMFSKKSPSTSKGNPLTKTQSSQPMAPPKSLPKKTLKSQENIAEKKIDLFEEDVILNKTEEELEIERQVSEAKKSLTQTPSKRNQTLFRTPVRKFAPPVDEETAEIEEESEKMRQANRLARFKIREEVKKQNPEFGTNLYMTPRTSDLKRNSTSAKSHEQILKEQALGEALLDIKAKQQAVQKTFLTKTPNGRQLSKAIKTPFHELMQDTEYANDPIVQKYIENMKARDIHSSH